MFVSIFTLHFSLLVLIALLTKYPLTHLIHLTGYQILIHSQSQWIMYLYLMISIFLSGSIDYHVIPRNPHSLSPSIPPGIKVLHGNEDILLGMSSVVSSQAQIVFTNLLAFTTKDPDLEWKVVSEAPSGWQVPSFDDSNWSIVHFQSSLSLGYMDSTSVYMRHSFSIPSLTTFLTLNVAVTLPCWTHCLGEWPSCCYVPCHRGIRWNIHCSW